MGKRELEGKRKHLPIDEEHYGDADSCERRYRGEVSEIGQKSYIVARYPVHIFYPDTGDDDPHYEGEWVQVRC